MTTLLSNRFRAIADWSLIDKNRLLQFALSAILTAPLCYLTVLGVRSLIGNAQGVAAVFAYLITFGFLLASIPLLYRGLKRVAGITSTGLAAWSARQAGLVLLTTLAVALALMLLILVWIPLSMLFGVGFSLTGGWFKVAVVIALGAFYATAILATYPLAKWTVHKAQAFGPITTYAVLAVVIALAWIAGAPSRECNAAYEQARIGAQIGQDIQTLNACFSNGWRPMGGVAE